MDLDELRRLAIIQEYNREYHPKPCPKGCGCITAEDPDRNDCACDGPCCMDPDWPPPEYVGLSEYQATLKARDNGYRVRVAMRDNNHFVLTMDYRTDRVNFDIVHGTVVASSIG